MQASPGWLECIGATLPHLPPPLPRAEGKQRRRHCRRKVSLPAACSSLPRPCRPPCCCPQVLEEMNQRRHPEAPALDVGALLGQLTNVNRVHVSCKGYEAPAAAGESGGAAAAASSGGAAGGEVKQFSKEIVAVRCVLKGGGGGGRATWDPGGAACCALCSLLRSAQQGCLPACHSQLDWTPTPPHPSRSRNRQGALADGKPYIHHNKATTAYRSTHPKHLPLPPPTTPPPPPPTHPPTPTPTHLLQPAESAGGRQAARGTPGSQRVVLQHGAVLLGGARAVL